jgi:ABC-type sugar transport system, periplasmic component
MLKRKIALVLSAVIAFSSLAACAGGGAASSQPAGDSSADSAAPTAPVTITYISSTILESPEGKFEQMVVDSFNAQHKDIQVKVEGVAANDLMKKYVTLATSDTMPDFFLANQLDIGTIVDMGIAADVSKIFDEEYLNGFDKKCMDAFTVDGVAYGIPWFSSASGVIYRKDLFDNKGLKEPTTWQELVDTAKQLTGDGNYGITLVGTKDASGAGRFQYVLRNFGVDEFTKDAGGKWTTDIGSQKYIDALRAYTDLDVKEGVVPPGVIETNYATAVSLFSSGKAAMLITGANAIGAITSQVPELKGKLGSFPVPAVARSVSSAAGFGYFITPGKHEKESAEFIKFMLENENALAFSQTTGRLPTRTDTLADPQINSMPELAGFLKAAKNSYTIPNIAGYSEVNDIHGEAYQSVLTKTATVEQAAQKAQKRAQQICDKANQGK